jgi:hypothetical protein
LSTFGSFTIFDLEGDENAILYREDNIGDAIEHAPEKVGHYRHWFEVMWGRSYTVEDSRRILQAKRAALIADLARKRIDEYPGRQKQAPGPDG